MRFLLGLTLIILMFLYCCFVVVPNADANRPVFEIKDEKLRVYEYETRYLRCNIAIIDVSMIGAQISHSCVRKENERSEQTSPSGRYRRQGFPTSIK